MVLSKAEGDGGYRIGRSDRFKKQVGHGPKALWSGIADQRRSQCSRGKQPSSVWRRGLVSKA
ncbi:protein of unknown function [Paraburkholderia kururiensis]